MKRRLLRGAACTAAASAILVGLNVAPASAYVATLDNARGYAQSNTYGEHVYVWDDAADGYGTRAQYQIWRYPQGGNPGYWTNWSSSCFDDTSQGSPETHCNYNIPEGERVRLHLWSTRNGKTYDHKYSASHINE